MQHATCSKCSRSCSGAGATSSLHPSLEAAANHPLPLLVLVCIHHLSKRCMHACMHALAGLMPRGRADRPCRDGRVARPRPVGGIMALRAVDQLESSWLHPDARRTRMARRTHTLKEKYVSIAERTQSNLISATWQPSTPLVISVTLPTTRRCFPRTLRDLLAGTWPGFGIGLATNSRRIHLKGTRNLCGQKCLT